MDRVWQNATKPYVKGGSTLKNSCQQLETARREHNNRPLTGQIFTEV